MWDQLLLLARRFPDLHVEGAPSADLPLFPTTAGRAFQKQAFVDTVRAAAGFLDLPSASPDGSMTLTGHSMRVSGAQGLASLGLDTYAIQLLGRWGSASVLRYVRDSTVSLAAAQARRASITATLAELTRAAGDEPWFNAAAPIAEDQVRMWFSAWWPDALAQARSSLAEELTSHLRQARAGRPEPAEDSTEESEAERPMAENGTTASLSPAAPSGPSEVANKVSKITHLIAIGPPELDAQAWVTMCGWTFGRFATAGPAAPGYKRCRVCFP